MDTSTVSTITDGLGALGLVAPYILSGGIIPLVVWLNKRWNLVVSYQFQEFALWLIVALALRHFLRPEMSIESLIVWALSLLGGSSLIYGGYQTGKTISKPNGNTP
jgi:hypothetical protein